VRVIGQYRPHSHQDRIGSGPKRLDPLHVSGEEILTCLRAMLEIFPSAVIAQLTMM